MNLGKDILQQDKNKQDSSISPKCRICLDTSNLRTMWAVIHKNLTCNDILKSTLSLQLRTAHGFPETICSKCIKEIIKIHKFKQKIEDTEKYFDDILSTKIKLENEVDGLESDVTQHFAHNDHDYFMEFKPPAPKPDEVVERINGEIDLRIDKLTYNSKKENFICKICKSIFTDENELKEHSKKEGHPIRLRKLYPCTICGKGFSKCKLLIHIRVHTKERPFVCKICNRKFTIKSNLKRHIMIHTGEKAYICDICGKGFIQGLSLKHHRKTHFKMTDQNSRTRKRKEPSQQSIPTTFKCDFCGRKFKRILMFQAHLKKHNVTNFVADAVASTQDKSEVPRPFKCLICHQSYTSKHNLKQHQRVHGEKKYLCAICGKGFHQGGTLQIHFRKHTGEKPHSCKICKKSFAYRSSLETHMFLHTGEKPYVCNVCGKAFKQSPHLTHHMRVHTGEKPHQCPNCSKCFALKGNLTVHIRTHTGETPYKCDVCGRGFYDSSSMKKHRKGHGVVVKEPEENNVELEVIN